MVEIRKQSRFVHLFSEGFGVTGVQSEKFYDLQNPWNVAGP